MSLRDKLNTPVADHFGLRRRQGDVGIELEIEGRNLFGGTIGDWVAKLDGSLRGGMEYVSCILRRDNVRESFSTLITGLKTTKSEPVPTYRCSTHIHENYLDETFERVVGAYVCWALIEPVVFRVLPAGRDGSLFCVSSYDSGDIPGYVSRLCDNLLTGGWHPRGKYSSLNMSRLGPSDHPALGTLEYRVFPPTLDPDTIHEWCQWTGNIKAFVRGQEDRTYLEMVRWAEANPMKFIYTILGKCPFEASEAGSLVDFGARQAYEIVRAFIEKQNEKSPATKKGKSTVTVGIGGVGAAALEGFEEVAPADPVGHFRPRRARIARPVVPGAGAVDGGAPAPRRRRARPGVPLGG